MKSVFKLDSNPSQLPPLRAVVQKFAIAPQKSLGQNFLFDLNITRRVARAAGDLSGFTVLEIGPGPGGLTRGLLEEGAKKVIAIEQDHRCIAALEEIQGAYPGRLEIIHGDALAIKEETLSIGSKFKVVSNLPYNIGTVLLLKWLNNLELFESFTLMFQKEVADRIKAMHGNKQYGRLSVMTQVWCNVSHQFDLPPSVFVPPPKINSSVINIIPRPKALTDLDRKILEKLCQVTFGQRRKTLRSSLKQITKDPDILVAGSSISLTKRPEELSIEQFCELANLLQKCITGNVL